MESSSSILDSESSISSNSADSTSESSEKEIFTVQGNDKTKLKETRNLRYVVIIMGFIIIFLVAIIVGLAAVLLHFVVLRSFDHIFSSNNKEDNIHLGAYINTHTNESAKFYTKNIIYDVPPEGLSYYDADGTAVLIYPSYISPEYDEEYKCSGDCECCVECLEDEDCEGWDVCDEGNCKSKWDYWRRSSSSSIGDEKRRRNLVSTTAGRLCYNFGRVFALVLASSLTLDLVGEKSLEKECDSICKDEYLFSESAITSSIVSEEAGVDKVVERSDADSNNNKEEVLILDVRTRFEYNDGHILGSVNIPLDEVLYAKDELPPDKQHPIITYCAVGIRAQHAKDKLHAMGYTNVKNGGGLGNMLSAGHDIDE